MKMDENGGELEEVVIKYLTLLVVVAAVERSGTVFVLDASGVSV